MFNRIQSDRTGADERFADDDLFVCQHSSKLPVVRSLSGTH
jgi:hypothetical protein